MFRTRQNFTLAIPKMSTPKTSKIFSKAIIRLEGPKNVDSTINLIQLNDLNDCISRKLPLQICCPRSTTSVKLQSEYTRVTWVKVHYIFSLLCDITQLQRKRYQQCDITCALEKKTRLFVERCVCGVKTSTVTPSFYYIFNISLSCNNNNIPSFIGNLWTVLLLGNHLNQSAHVLS